MRERRRLKLATQQLTLAKVARREAMAGLADAITEETRSSALASRSQDLMSAYAQPQPGTDVSGLQDRAAFVRSVKAIKDQAEEARRDASDQVEWQARSLAAADTRAGRLEDQASEARREIEALLEKREAQVANGVARKSSIGTQVAQVGAKARK